MDNVLRVGIIGASADRGWAKVSHVPAVQAISGMELWAVASGDQAEADAAAKAFNAQAAYGDGHDLVRDPAVDVVTIAVKVPDHRELVLAALSAGKHVYCEWPLGRNAAETEEMAAAVKLAGVHAVIGLQTRANAASRRASDLLKGGAIGRPLSARVYSSTMAFGPSVDAAMAFAEDPENGATLLTIQGAHTLDLAVALLGPLGDLCVLTTTQYPEIDVGKPAKRQTRVTPDHVLVAARLSGGAPLSIEVAGGRPADASPFRFEVTGETGVLSLEGGAPRGFQSGRMRLSINGEAQGVEEGETASLPDEAANVAGMYAALRDDIRRGGVTAPDFAHATQLAHLVERVETAGRQG